MNQEEGHRIHLVFAFDQNFIQHCCVCLASVFVNNPTEHFVIHIIYDELNVNEIKPLQKFIKKFAHSCNVYLIDKALANSFKISHHVSSATYYRLFIPGLIKNIGRVIYLDCDILIAGGLHHLWTADLQGAIVGAVKDYGQESFNAGVLLIDLDRWREASITQKCVDWIGQNNADIKFWDQDALNAVLGKSIRPLPEKWNFMGTNIGIDVVEKEDIRIIHFVGTHKPWNYYCEHPLKSEYFRYIAFTPWKNYKIEQDNWRFKTKQKIKSLLKKSS